MRLILKAIRTVLERSVFNPASWTGVALVLIAAWAVAHLLGWRVDTAIICGTVDVTRGNPQRVMMQGTAYALTYFAAVVISPILLLASGLFVLMAKVLEARREKSVVPVVSAGEKSEV